MGSPSQISVWVNQSLGRSVMHDPRLAICELDGERPIFIGKGTPIPLMATQKLVITGPYTYCRNPMTLGTAFFYLGVAIWIGSLSAFGLGLIYPVGILIYIKLIEEKELEERFGSEYLEYKRKTPFLIPRLWEKGCMK